MTRLGDRVVVTSVAQSGLPICNLSSLIMMSTGRVYSSSGTSPFVNVNKSLTLTGTRLSDGSLRPGEAHTLVTDLRYEVEGASLGWDSDRDLTQPEPRLHFLPENQLNIDQSTIKNKFLSVFNENYNLELNINHLDDVHKKGSARLISLIGRMSMETIRETHTALGDPGMAAFFEELVLQTGTSASAMFILVTSDT